MRRAQDAMSAVICLIDVRDRKQPLVYVSPGFESLTGWRADEALGRSWKLNQGVETDPETAARLTAAVDNGEEIRVNIRQHRRDGTAYWSETVMMPAPNRHGVVTHYMSGQKNVTKSVEAAQQAAHMAYHDALTGLPNRAQLQEHLSLALARAERNESAFGLVFFDLDLFKEVNDHHGHDSGDRLLEDVAGRWRSITRDGDVLTRYGGDEFVLLITDMLPSRARSATAAAAARYTDALGRPFDAPGTPCGTIEIGVSTGIAVYPEDADTPPALLLAADVAMYASKRAQAANGHSRPIA
jgi:diguanylate cyclase (GGDEF)-like protein/PAS domain S-box-containing protein